MIRRPPISPLFPYTTLFRSNEIFDYNTHRIKYLQGATLAYHCKHATYYHHPGGTLSRRSALSSGAPDGGSKFAKDVDRFGPSEAGIRDALSVHERFARDEFLRARDQIALNHHADDATVARGNLTSDVVRDDGLASVVLAAVGVRAVDHDARRQPGLLKLPAGRIHRCSVKVGEVAPSAQNDVALRIAGGGEDGSLSVLGAAEERVLAARGKNGVNRNLHVARRSILEADRTRKAADELAMHLALRSTRADCAPRHEIDEILRRDDVEKLGAGRNAHHREIKQKMPRDAQAVVDLVSLVEMRVVDQALPPNGGARLFKVDAHHDAEIFCEFVDERLEYRSVLARGLGIVDRTRANNDQQPRIAAGEYLANLGARSKYGGRGLVGDRELFLQKDRRKNHLGPLDAEIICAVKTMHEI